MDVDIKTLAKYPTNSEDWIVTLLIGGVAIFLSVLIIPWFVVSGYLVRTIRAGMNHEEEPPVFDEWESLFKEGVIAGIIGIIYGIIPILVFAVFIGGSFLALLSGSGGGVGIGILGILAGILITVISGIVFAYIGSAGLVNYVEKGTFSAGFEFDAITDVITSRDYLIAWGYIIVLYIIVSAIISIIGNLHIPYLGSLIETIVGFYALTISGWLLGDGFTTAVGMGEQQPSSTPSKSTDDLNSFEREDEQ